MYANPNQPQPIYAAPRASAGYSPNLAAAPLPGRHSPNPQPIYGLPRAGAIDGRYSPNLAGGGLLGTSPNLGRASPNLSGATLGGGGFEVERVSRPPSAMGMGGMMPGGVGGGAAYDPEFVYRENVSKLIAAKTRPFSVSGRIPLDPAHLVLFFRAKTGTSHSLDFPIDIDYSTPPALDVLISACRTHQAHDTGIAHESYYYPPNLPLTPSVEIANHPLLDAIRSALLPTLPVGTYLTATRDRLDILLAGGRLPPQPSAQAVARRDGRVATLNITLPVRFTGGALTVRYPFDGRVERLDSVGTAAGQTDLEWTAFLGECEHDVDVVTRGCRMSLSYAVFAKTFGGVGTASPFVSGRVPESVSSLPLFTPNQPFLDLLPPVLQMSRGRKIAFLLAHDYEVDPSVALAESLVPQLKGGDALLHITLKTYFKLTPALHYTAGGYLWPLDRPVEIFDEEPQARSAYAPPPPADALRARVEASGAVPLSDAGVQLLTDWRAGQAGVGVGMPGGREETPVGKARVHFVSNGLLEKLVVNVAVVVYVA
ncbi:hypothetical protein MIND_00982800 [Mycena indigotica]|uniref:Uncharacterized protein n=1 Tax=Mycena indigotica TaxID=2126181 RepID=A0A8H6SGM7_9AGAR|nr:uncharacterized protein MIND_00982800 [Mycena indigotica]KAF7297490.1 hypothetical protein MIND_00982800 [Mycena indigotica]